jgi:Trypsin-like peptidase domain
VYGSDDRVDYFQLSAAQDQALIAGAGVSLVTKEMLDTTGGDLSKAPSWAETDGLCPDEPFADQPAAAFCSGVLVDWDLVLTADHCTRVYALSDMKVVFDDFYVAPGQLAQRAQSVYSVAEIVSEALDPQGSVPRLDYAWLRLTEPVRPPRQPVPIYATAAAVQVGDPVISVGTPGGIPVKWDAGGTVQDNRSAYTDYFIADPDNSAGSSGGGAFDSTLTLTGVTARGGTDFTPTPDGCNRTVHQADGQAVQEQFTYASAALQGLCGSAGGAKSSLCRADCGNPCSALPPPPPSPTGCALGAADLTRGRWSEVGLLALAVAVAVRRRS